MTLTLSDLAGPHFLEGAEEATIRVNRHGFDEILNCFRFRLDNMTYTVIEDPGDGLRSKMEEIVISQVPLQNTFPPVAVIAEHITGKDMHDILEIRTVETRKLVIEVGTQFLNDYYPCFVHYFNPQALGEWQKESK